MLAGQFKTAEDLLPVDLTRRISNLKDAVGPTGAAGIATATGATFGVDMGLALLQQQIAVTVNKGVYAGQPQAIP